MLSRREVFTRLRDGFIGLRLDWEQGNHYKERFGFILGTGDQMLLDPEGNPVPHAQAATEGRGRLIYGRHGRDTTAEVLDEVLARFPPKPGPLALKLDWFLWPQKASRGGKGRYPVSPEAIAGFARLPLAVLEGPIPAALEDQDFLRRHARQFIWVRGRVEGPSRLAIRRVRDGLPESLPSDLALLAGETLAPEALGKALDAAWLAYMKDRPRTARGYLENPHGKWMRGRAEQMVGEEDALLRAARQGTLLAPGRAADLR